jgi:hypothetical protein
MAHKWLSISYERKGNFDAAFKTALKLQEIAGYSPARLSRLRNGYSSGGLRRFYEEELYVDKLYVDKERAKPGKFDKRGEPEAYLGFGERLKAIDCLEDGYTKLGKQLNLSLVHAAASYNDAMRWAHQLNTSARP